MIAKIQYYFDTQNINLKNDRKRSALPLCKAKNRPHDIRKMITRTDPMIRAKRTVPSVL